MTSLIAVLTALIVVFAMAIAAARAGVLQVTLRKPARRPQPKEPTP